MIYNMIKAFICTYTLLFFMLIFHSIDFKYEITIVQDQFWTNRLWVQLTRSLALKQQVFF